jgi:hypothetical protein
MGAVIDTVEIVLDYQKSTNPNSGNLRWIVAQSFGIFASCVQLSR